MVSRIKGLMMEMTILLSRMGQTTIGSPDQNAVSLFPHSYECVVVSMLFSPAFLQNLAFPCQSATIAFNAIVNIIRQPLCFK